MSLFVNIGNTRISYRRKKKVVSLSHQEFFKRQIIRSGERVYLCSVVPKLTKKIVLKYLHQVSIIQRKDIPLKISYGSGCGMDRLVNAFAANQKFPDQNLVVVDMGTAITVDFIDRQKGFVGGWISAGARLQSEALAEKTGQLFEVKFTKNDFRKKQGRSTRDSLALGQIKILQGLLRQAEFDAVQIFKSKKFKAILTGGDARFFKVAPYQFIPDLTLMGLACLSRLKG